jgi:hypothetical protein
VYTINFLGLVEWSQIIGSLATAIALGVIAYQAFHTKQELKETKQQLELTREQMKLVKKELQYNFRPWIYRENFGEYLPLRGEKILSESNE